MQTKKYSETMIWTFIGYILMIYGALIFGLGAYHWIAKKPFHTALASIHPDICWGSIMLIMGFLFYFFNRKPHESTK